MFSLVLINIISDLTKDYVKKKCHKLYGKYWKTPNPPIPHVQITKKVKGSPNIEIIKILNAEELERYSEHEKYGPIDLQDFIYV